MNVQKKPAARLGRQAASKTELHKITYTKPAPPSRIKYKLLVEIRGLVGALQNPFLSKAEKETYEVLLKITMRKLIVLQNSSCGGCGCVESKDSERPE